MDKMLKFGAVGISAFVAGYYIVNRQNKANGVGVPEMPPNTLAVAATWANGITSVFTTNYEEEIGPAIVSSTEAKAFEMFGNNATSMFPVKMVVTVKDKTMQGSITLDANNVPSLNLVDTDPKQSLLLTAKAEKDHANRTRYENEALKWMRSRPSVKSANENFQDFFMPIPTR